MRNLESALTDERVASAFAKIQERLPASVDPADLLCAVIRAWDTLPVEDKSMFLLEAMGFTPKMLQAFTVFPGPAFADWTDPMA